MLPFCRSCLPSGHQNSECILAGRRAPGRNPQNLFALHLWVHERNTPARDSNTLVLYAGLPANWPLKIEMHPGRQAGGDDMFLLSTEEFAQLPKESVLLTEEYALSTEEFAQLTKEFALFAEEFALFAEEFVPSTEESAPSTEKALTVTEEALTVTEEALTVTEEALTVTEEPLTVTEEAHTERKNR